MLILPCAHKACTSPSLIFHLCCQLATPAGSARCVWQLARWLWGKGDPACEDPGQFHEHHEAAERSEGM